MSDPLESRIEREASEKARKLGMMVLKLNVKGQVGWPDRLFIWQGHQIFIEFKAAKQKPGPCQKYIHEQLRKHHIEVYVVDNLIDARSIINELHSRVPYIRQGAGDDGGVGSSVHDGIWSKVSQG